MKVPINRSKESDVFFNKELFYGRNQAEKLDSKKAHLSI